MCKILDAKERLIRENKTLSPSEKEMQLMEIERQRKESEKLSESILEQKKLTTLLEKFTDNFDSFQKNVGKELSEIWTSHKNFVVQVTEHCNSCANRHDDTEKGIAVLKTIEQKAAWIPKTVGEHSKSIRGLKISNGFIISIGSVAFTGIVIGLWTLIKHFIGLKDLIG